MLALGQAVSCARRWPQPWLGLSAQLAAICTRCRTTKIRLPSAPRFQALPQKKGPLLAHLKRIPLKSGLVTCLSSREHLTVNQMLHALNLSSRLRASASLARTKFGKRCLRKKRRVLSLIEPLRASNMHSGLHRNSVTRSARKAGGPRHSLGVNHPCTPCAWALKQALNRCANLFRHQLSSWRSCALTDLHRTSEWNKAFIDGRKPANTGGGRNNPRPFESARPVSASMSKDRVSISTSPGRPVA